MPGSADRVRGGVNPPPPLFRQLIDTELKVRNELA